MTIEICEQYPRYPHVYSRASANDGLVIAHVKRFADGALDVLKCRPYGKTNLATIRPKRRRFRDWLVER
ncbi:MAG: hypothetical protein J6Z49_08350 [Kiritimatiellae bacterium]|nr:hypothetical protein [Kiritimatiellia bacterium]